MDDIILWLEQNSSTCIYVSFFGHECPGCGGQRSFILLLKGEISESFAMYPALFPLIAFVLFIISSIIFKIPKAIEVIKYGFLSVFALILISYFYKMITIGV